MNEAIDLVGSYLIGGLVLLALTGLILHFNNKAQETTLSQISQYSIVEVGKIIEHDFDNLGYGVSSGNKILSITSNSISFLGDMNSDGNIDTVTYTTFQQNQGTFLRRSLGSQSSSQLYFPIKSLTIEGIDSAGNSTSQISNIKSILFTLVTSEKTFSDSQTQVGSAWVRQFFPPNL